MRSLIGLTLSLAVHFGLLYFFLRAPSPSEFHRGELQIDLVDRPDAPRKESGGGSRFGGAASGMAPKSLSFGIVHGGEDAGNALVASPGDGGNGDGPMSSAPCLEEIYRALEAGFAGAEIPDTIKSTTETTGRFRLNGNGESLQVLELRDHGSEMKTLVAKAVLLSASKRFASCSEFGGSELSAMFRIEITSSQGRLPTVLPKIEGRHFNFVRGVFRPLMFQARNTLDQRAQTLGIDLVQLYEWIFKKPEGDVVKIQRDLGRRLIEARRVCETQQADGACYEAAKIFEAFGEDEKAAAFYRRACELGLSASCR